MKSDRAPLLSLEPMQDEMAQQLTQRLPEEPVEVVFAGNEIPWECEQL